MDELTDKITQLLNDPNGMDTVKSLANSLMSGNDKSGDNIGNIDMSSLSGLLGSLSANSNSAVSTQNSDGDMPLSPAQLQSLMRVLSKMKSGAEDERIKLLKALKPHLSEERRQRTDKAIKMLKLIDLLPLLKEAGLGDLF